MLRSTFFSAIAASLLLGSLACDDGGGGFAIDATGSVLGLTFVDRNGNGLLDLPADGPQAGVGIQLLPTGGGSPVATAVSNALGSFELRNVPVGVYQVHVDSATVPDSLRVVKVDSARVRVAAGDSVGVVVTLSFASVTVQSARALPTGRRVFVEGVTLNGLNTFGDSTLHLSDSTGAIRAIRVTPVNVNAGTRVRVLGTTDLRDGQPTLGDGVVTPLASAPQPAPVVLNTQKAASADGGVRDAALVQVVSAQIVGAQTNTAGDFVVSVNDGSGLLEVVVDRNAGIATNSLIPGALLTATGVLVPTATAGTWQLKPRAGADLVVSFAAVTVAQARALQVGRIVTIEGVALNSWLTFGDVTVHVADSTGSIRTLLTATGNALIGDRVRVLGTVALRDGQPVLANASASVLGPGVLPAPAAITTAMAVTADNGRLDASLVRVASATISSTANVGGDLVLTVSDGSGPLQVVLDKDAGFAFAPYVVGARFDITGVLLAAAGGANWQLKPRQQSDLVVR